MRPLTIGEVAERCGVATSALRFYEREGLIPKAGRRGGKRVWSDDILDRMALIRMAKGAGFTVPEIRLLVAGFPDATPAGHRWRELARTKSAELDERIAELLNMRRVLEAVTGCACRSLDDCSRAIRARSGPQP